MSQSRLAEELRAGLLRAESSDALSDLGGASARTPIARRSFDHFDLRGPTADPLSYRSDGDRRNNLDSETQAAFASLAETAEAEVWEGVTNRLARQVSTYDQEADLLLFALATQNDDSRAVADLEHVTHSPLPSARALAKISDENPLLREYVVGSGQQRLDQAGALLPPVGEGRDERQVQSSPQGARQIRLSVAERFAEYQPSDWIRGEDDAESRLDETSSLLSDTLEYGQFDLTGDPPNQSAPPTLKGIKYKSRRRKGRNSGFGYDTDPGDGFASSLKNVDEAEEPHTRVGVLKCAFNLANDVLGAGMVAVPYFVIKAGFYTGLMLLLFYAFASFCSLMLVHHIAMRRGVLTFSEMAFLAFGKPGMILSALAVFSFNYGVFVGNLLLLGQLAQKLLTLVYWLIVRSDPSGFWAVLLNFRVVLVLCVLTLSPMTFYKSMDRFVKLSFLCNAATAFLFATIVYATFSQPEKLSWSRLSPDGFPLFDAIGALQGLGGICYLFTCHDLSFHVVHTLERPTRARYMIVAGTAISVATIMFSLVSVCGLLLFGDHVNPDVMLNFKGAGESGTIVVDLCRLAVVMNICLNIPFFTFMPRVGMLSMLQMWKPHWVREQPGEGALTTARLAKLRQGVHVVATVTVLCCVTGVALTGVSLGEVFGVTGGVAGISICLLFPLLSWLRIRQVTNRERQAVLVGPTAPVWTAEAAAAEVEQRPELMTEDDEVIGKEKLLVNYTSGRVSQDQPDGVSLLRRTIRILKTSLAVVMIIIGVLSMASIFTSFFIP